MKRLENDPQSGSIVFSTDENQDSNIIFEKYPLGLLNSLLVQNAGKQELNGTYNYVDINNLKPFYTKGTEGYYYIIWINNRWDIYDFSFNSSDPLYFSIEDTNYPWQVNSWTVVNINNSPPPSITIL